MSATNPLRASALSSSRYEYEYELDNSFTGSYVGSDTSSTDATKSTISEEGYEDEVSVIDRDVRHIGWKQFKACLLRRVLQRRNSWVGLLLEILIPVIFALILLVLTLGFGKEKTASLTSFEPKKSFEEDNHNSLDFFYQFGLCSNTTLYDGIPTCADTLALILSPSPDDDSEDAGKGSKERKKKDPPKETSEEASSAAGSSSAPGQAGDEDMYINCSTTGQYDFDFLNYSYLNDDFDVDDEENKSKYPINEDNVPLRGLCGVFPLVTEFVNYNIAAFSRLDNLDNVIAFQWLLRSVPGLVSGSSGAATNFLSSAGLASSNSFSSLQANGNIMFAPKANIPDELIDYFYRYSKLFQYVFSRKRFIFDTVAEAEEVIQSHKYGRTMALVEIEKMDSTGLSLKLHMNQSALPDFQKNVDYEYLDGYENDRAEVFLASGTSALQQLVYQFYLQHKNYSGIDNYTRVLPPNPRLFEHRDPKTGNYVSGIENIVSQEAQADYMAAAAEDKSTFSLFTVVMYSGGTKKPHFLAVSAYLAAFFFSFFLFYPVTQMARHLVMDKEMRLTEAMQVMGLNPYINFAAWVVESVLLIFLTSVLITIILYFGVLQHSNFFLVFVVIFLFGLSVVPLAGIFASFFNTATVVSIFSPVAYAVLVCPYFLVFNMTPDIILGISIFSPSCFGALFEMLLRWDLGSGFRNKNLYSPLVDPHAVFLIIFLVADIIIYSLLMLYLDAVLPKQWGTRRHPLFFIKEPFQYFRDRCCPACCPSCWAREGRYDAESTEDGRDGDGMFESDAIPLEERALDIAGLCKIFKRGGKKFTAVDHFCWDMPLRGISVLLGHNGAGKSTLMNMLTGMLPPSEGECRVTGYSVRSELRQVRQQLGFCPQHNILWPDLNCREHLEFYGKIKGLKGEDLKSAVRWMLREVDLEAKEKYPAGALSGGQKRKLSIAVAFVGRNPLVCLDEPTAGLDVAARRHTWELLLRMSETTSVLLTTHFMDEADLLGDRIAMMSGGRLMCSGSSLYLKSRLGVGYNLTLAVDQSTDVESLNTFIGQCLPSSRLTDMTRREMTYQVPKHEENSFPGLFSSLEQENSWAYGMKGFSVATSSLEEVFIDVTSKTLTEEELNMLKPSNKNFDLVFDCEVKPRGCSLYAQQLKYSILKRLYYCRRDTTMMWFQIVSPVFFVLFAMLLGLSFRPKPTQTLNLDYHYPTRSEFVVSGCERLFNYSAVSDYLSDYDMELTDVGDTTSNRFEVWDYLADTRDSHSLDRYGAVSCPTSNDGPDQLVYAGVSDPVTLFYNTSSYFELAISTKEMYNYYLFSQRPEARIDTALVTLPQSESEQKASGVFKIFVTGVLIMIPYNIIHTSCISYIVRERANGTRHLQKLAGLNFLVYWFGSFVFDLAIYLVSTILIILLFLIFSQKDLVGKDAIGPCCVVFLIFGFVGTLFSYCASFLFSSPGGSQIAIMTFGLLTGFVMNIVAFVLEMLQQSGNVSKIVRFIFRVSPYFAVTEGIINLNIFSTFFAPQDPTQTRWSLDITLYDIIYMSAEIPVLIAVLLIIDSGCISRWCSRRKEEDIDNSEDVNHIFSRTPSFTDPPMSLSSFVESTFGDERSSVDSDVQRAEEHVKEKKEDSYAAVARRLKKTFKTSAGCCKKRQINAVDDLTFGTTTGEVFGLLGTNGAGKTTTISILCQQQKPTSGNVTVCGYDTVRDSNEAMLSIGYCPQFDATLDLMSVEEHLRVFCGIRGVAPFQQDELVEQLLQLSGLGKYRKVTSAALSGGNRRKLSFALSIIGGPPVLLLDEPSAGMDPVARRGLWSSIQSVSHCCSVLLTTHHLEEIEALADCVAIMVDGRMRCIGSKMHLKKKFGSGFEMSLRLLVPEGSPSFEAAKEFVMRYVSNTIPWSTLNEVRGNRLVYTLPAAVHLSEVFAHLQRDKDSLGISDYSVSQTTIEQVFMRVSEEALAEASEEAQDSE